MLLAYKESAQGQMLHEGISEAGAMASATAAGSAYATHGEPMIPFYIFYSMFGFQRTGDSIWAMADQLARGFLIGATAGRTTLTGEGLQHADGHSPLLAATNPAVVHYDPAFAYEISHIVQDGLRRMYGSTEEHPHGENVIFYITVYNEPIVQPKEPENVDVEGMLKGIYHVADAPRSGDGDAPRVQLLASGVGFPWITEAQRMLAEEWGVAADTWSVTSWNELARDAVAAEEWNLLHPGEEPRTPYVTDEAARTPTGPVVAVSRLHARRAGPDRAAGCPATATSSAPTASASPTPARPPAASSTSTPSRSSSRRCRRSPTRGEVKPRGGPGGVRRSTASTTRPPSPASSRRAATPDAVAHRSLRRTARRCAEPLGGFGVPEVRRSACVHAA